MAFAVQTSRLAEGTLSPVQVSLGLQGEAEAVVVRDKLGVELVGWVFSRSATLRAA